MTPGAQSLNYGDGGLRGESGLVENKMTFHLNTFNFYIPNKRLGRLNHSILKGKRKREPPLIRTRQDAFACHRYYRINLPGCFIVKLG